MTKLSRTELKILVFNKMKKENKSYSQAYEEVKNTLNQVNSVNRKTKIQEITDEKNKTKGFKEAFKELKSL